MTATSIPPLPLPPSQYDPVYMSQLIKNLSHVFRLMQYPGQTTTSSIQIINYATSATGLPSGTVWVDTANSYVLKVVP